MTLLPRAFVPSVIALCLIAPLRGQGQVSPSTKEAASPPLRTERVSAHLRGQDKTELMNGYRLLYDLAQNETQVDKVFIIKKGISPLEETIKKIAEAARKLEKDLESVARYDSVEPFGPSALPPVEIATRKSIADFKRNRILSGSPAQFQKELLVSQIEALTYGSNLLDTLIATDPNPTRVQILQRHVARWKNLRQEIFNLIPNPPEP